MSLRVLLTIILIFSVGCAGPAENVSKGGKDRIVSVAMHDSFRFEPSAIDVSPGESVEFQIVNQGTMVHEFLIGDEEEQREFEKEMMEGHMEHGGGSRGVSVEPGKEASFVFVFPDTPGELLFGCHEPGHYAAGMHGKFRISGANTD